MQAQQKNPCLLLGLWLIGAIVLIACSMAQCDGHLIYSLNAPYIHLSVADSLLNGGYGLNTFEHASPSSSILYPLLLALTEKAGLGVWGPLGINLLAMGAAVYGVGCLIQDHVLAPACAPGRAASRGAVLGLGLALCLVMNAWALVMTGLEHSLHVLALVVLLCGVMKIIDQQARADASLLLAIIALPLIRFEGAALALAALCALLLLRQRRAAVLTGLALGVLLLAWYGFTHEIGLQVLPCSVLLRSGSAAHVLGQSGWARLWGSLQGNWNTTLQQRQGRMLLALSALTVLLSALQYRRGLRRQALTLGGLALFSALAHVCGGQYGALPRYEIYILTLLVLCCLLLGRRHLHRFWARGLVMASLAWVALPYIQATLITPQAARAVYLMPYQLQRFAVGYWRQALATNGIGWVSYRNPHYVLDLEGLGSQAVCRMRLDGAWNPDSMAALVADRDIGMIIYYSVPQRPAPLAHWQKIAELISTPKRADPRGASFFVSFYLKPQSNPALAQLRLRQFSLSLPPGARIQFM